MNAAGAPILSPFAGPGRVIESPRTGERITVLETGEETGGELFAFELVLRPGGRVPSGHVHPTQVERFTVLEGRVRFRLGWRSLTARSGDAVTVPPRTRHRLANDGATPARIRVEVRPALRMEEMLATAAELFGSRRRLGTPRDLALFIREFDGEVRAPFLAGLLRIATAPLARAAGRLGPGRGGRAASLLGR